MGSFYTGQFCIITVHAMKRGHALNSASFCEQIFILIVQSETFEDPNTSETKFHPSCGQR